MSREHRGVSEETTTGVHRLYQMAEDRSAVALPGDQRQRLGDQEQVRQYLRLPALAHRRAQPRHRRDARRQGRRGLRLRRGRQGLRAGAARPGLPRHRHRDRSHLRPAGGRWKGYEVNTLEDVVETRTSSSPTTGNKDIITLDHMRRMKDKAIVGNIGHFDNEIDMAGLERAEGIERINIKPQYDERVRVRKKCGSHEPDASDRQRKRQRPREAWLRGARSLLLPVLRFCASAVILALAHGALQRIRPIRPLPRELGLGAPEVSVGRCLPDRSGVAAGRA